MRTTTISLLLASFFVSPCGYGLKCEGDDPEEPEEPSPATAAALQRACRADDRMVVTGTVATIHQVHSRGGVHLDLQTSKGLVQVHLGPSEYLRRTGFEPRLGESLTLSGTAHPRGPDVFIADKICSEKGTWTVRDRMDWPRWHGAHRHRGRWRSPADPWMTSDSERTTGTQYETNE